MIYARDNQKPLVGKGFTEPFTYTLDQGAVALKLTVNVKSLEDTEFNLLNGPIVLQTTEDPQHTYEVDPLTEQYLELGFWSKSFATPITGWRIRVVTDATLPGLVDMVAYG